MAQNIYDDPAFFAGYSQLRRQVDGLAGAPDYDAQIAAGFRRFYRADVADDPGKHIASLLYRWRT